MKQDYKSALIYYTKAEKLYPNFPLVHYGLGQLYLQSGNVRKAIPAFRKVLELVPDNPDALKIYGSLLAQDKHKEKAVEVLEKSHSRKKEDVEIALELAELQEDSAMEVQKKVNQC